MFFICKQASFAFAPMTNAKSQQFFLLPIGVVAWELSHALFCSLHVSDGRCVDALVSLSSQGPNPGGVGVVELTSQTIDGWLMDHDVTLIAFTVPR